MVDANAAQRESWNGPAGRHWVEHEARYDAQLVAYLEPILEAAELRATARVLDIGCGFGTLTVAAARRAPEGEAAGVDISRPMIVRARERAATEGVTNARFVEADAQTDAPGGPFDTVISRFGVMFFSDPVAAFTTIAGVTEAGGRLAFACWAPLAANPWMRVPAEAVAGVVDLPGPAPGTAGAPGPFSMGDADVVRDILGRAGFDDVHLSSIDTPIAVGGGLSRGAATDDESVLQDAVSTFRGTSIGRVAFAERDAAIDQRLVEAIRTALAPFVTPSGVILDAAAWLVTATRR